ncbi:hypothetical protein L6164_028862 [Bauhinia variegata]|uniref:Uncharacterized protein n=1 Tax=Bauhinia variegata TaxID=167791 RepID=A0ACB9L7G4_BAUVA|nr:hypothetical protein L6164_028862 [Bauhinia variegata]
MHFSSIEILNSKLYALVTRSLFGRREERLIRVFDLQNPNITMVQVLRLPAYHEVMFDYLITGNSNYHVSNREVYYLGKDAVSGDLLLIRAIYDFDLDLDLDRVGRRIIDHYLIIQNFINPPFTKYLRLWKYQYSDYQWIELDDLGDCSIFLGSIGFTVISTSNLTHQGLVEKNSIYFAHWKNCSGSRSSLWELEMLVG